MCCVDAKHSLPYYFLAHHPTAILSCLHPHVTNMAMQCFGLLEALARTAGKLLHTSQHCNPFYITNARHPHNASSMATKRQAASLAAAFRLSKLEGSWRQSSASISANAETNKVACARKHRRRFKGRHVNHKPAPRTWRSHSGTHICTRRQRRA